MSVEPFKYLLQPVALERNGTGRVLRELPAPVLTVYNAEQAAEAVREFEAQLVNHNQEGTAMSETTDPTPEPEPVPVPDDGDGDENGDGDEEGGEDA